MKIGVVLVTYNRVAMLKKALELYENQTKKPDYIVVLNNHSTDSTGEFLASWEATPSEINHYVITTESNLGGSGGFNKALEYAQKLDAEWIWISDDDAYPTENCIEELDRFAQTDIVKRENIVAICSKILNNGNIDVGARCRLGSKWIGNIDLPIPENKYNMDYFFCDLFSYVGVAIEKNTLKKAGLPRSDFFIYGDDYEHAIRVSKFGRIVCVPSIVINHDRGASDTKEVSWRDYYETRNRLWICKNHSGIISFAIRIVLRRLTTLRSGSRLKLHIFNVAIEDAKNDRLGIHEEYKTGWTE